MNKPNAMSDGTVPIAEFRNLQKEFARNLEAFDRVSRRLDEHTGPNSDVVRALELSHKIVETMLDVFKPAGEPAEIGDPGPQVGVGDITYGDLEVASGSLGAALAWVRR